MFSLVIDWHNFRYVVGSWHEFYQLVGYQLLGVIQNKSFLESAALVALLC